VGEVELRSAQARSRLPMFMGGVAFLGLAVGLIGWINLYAAHRESRPAGLGDVPFEWFFAGTGSLIFVLSLVLATVFWLTPRSETVSVLSAAGPVFAGGTTVPWPAFERFELVWRPSGGRQLIGWPAATLPAELHRAVRPFLVSDLGDGGTVPLRLGDVDDSDVGLLRESLRGWTGQEPSERLIGD
jgi:hypothetical protein